MSSPTESPPSHNTSSWGSPPPPSNSSPPPPPDYSSSPPLSDSNQTSPPPTSESVTNQSPPPPSNNKESSPPPSSSNLFPTPPPPSRSQLPPAAKHKSNASSSSHRSSPEKGLSDDQKATIAGVAAGAALLLFILVAFLISCCCRRKKRKSRAQIHYYPNGNYYQGGQNNGNWHNNAGIHSGEHMVKIPPPPAGPPSGAVSSEYGWPMGPPPPPPPMMSSGEMNSAAYSGQHPQAMAPPRPSIGGFNQSSFTYNDLAAATGGFSQANLLGQGGFGYVHKGVLPNGKEVAVKSLKSNSGQGEREFQAEVEIISRVHHRHLVSLVGYCIAGPQRMLVYEFVPNGTLEYHLHGSGRPVMDFQTRLKIALGSAKGFAYLHEDCHPRIIHRDIKAANILLDYNFEAMVADFGLAKLSSDNNTHVSTRIMGTFGYLAPEYASSGKLTEKSDVYSYGVMLLELITGRRPVDLNNDDEDSLVDWARPILMRAAEGGSYEDLVDPRLENNYDPQEMCRMVACAGASIRHSARRRPKMSQIVRALEGDVSLDDLNSAAAVKSENSSATTFGSGGSSEYDGNPYDMKKFRKSVLSSQEFSSGEHGMTDEFVHPRI